MTARNIVDHVRGRPDRTAGTRPTIMRGPDGVTVYDWKRPRSINREVADSHWSRRAEQRNDDRTRWGWLWKMAKLPHFEAVEIVATAGYKGRAQDPGNCMPTVKAAIDALQDVGILDDDHGGIVRRLTFEVDMDARDDFLALTLRAAEPWSAP